MAATLSYLAVSKLLSAFQLPDANRTGHMQPKDTHTASNMCKNQSFGSPPGLTDPNTLKGGRVYYYLGRKVVVRL